ncbi:hypothetical protein ACJX0J_010839, partial [Zea mays]
RQMLKAKMGKRGQQRRQRNDVVVEDGRDRLETIVYQAFRPQLGVIERLQPVPVVVD